jgi:hypothetical protein
MSMIYLPKTYGRRAITSERSPWSLFGNCCSSEQTALSAPTALQSTLRTSTIWHSYSIKPHHDANRASPLLGTAVWCLASDETDSVKYHIDYAELYRYETNIIYPPIYAGTCHLSPLNGDADMIGGDFQANVRGVDHYRQFGYKGELIDDAEHYASSHFLHLNCIFLINR